MTQVADETVEALEILLAARTEALKVAGQALQLGKRERDNNIIRVAGDMMKKAHDDYQVGVIKWRLKNGQQALPWKYLPPPVAHW